MCIWRCAYELYTKKEYFWNLVFQYFSLWFLFSFLLLHSIFFYFIYLFYAIYYYCFIRKLKLLKKFEYRYKKICKTIYICMWNFVICIKKRVLKKSCGNSGNEKLSSDLNITWTSRSWMLQERILLVNRMEQWVLISFAINALEELEVCVNMAKAFAMG